MLWSPRRAGINMVELLVVLLILGLLIAILVSAVQHAREAARRTQSKNDLKQLGLALHNYHNVFQRFPPGGVFNHDGTAFHGWSTLIIPYIDASPLYNYFNFNVPWDDPRNIERFQKQLPVYHNPSLTNHGPPDRIAVTHYAGSDLVLYRNSSTAIADLTRGTSNTFLVGDAKGDFEPWGSPFNWRDVELGLNRDPQGFGCAVREVTHMLMADGTVKEFNHQTDASLFATLRGINAQWEKVPGDVSKPARR